VSDGLIRVCLVYSAQAREVLELTLRLKPGSTVRQALETSGLLAQRPDIDPATMTVGVWGRKVALTHVLRDQDRIEIYRPLKVDPKVARRERFVRQGARTAGLFTKKRPGAKAGY
jgi:putative ubiquitin-RnfH superfamily antitoxin RatB of RatAB toxin-antitoxin module